MIGKAEALELEFYPPGEGTHPDFEIIGAPCFDLIITIIDAEDLQVEIPSNGYLLCVVFSLIDEKQGSFVIDLDELIVFDGDLGVVIPTLAQEIVQLLTSQSDTNDDKGDCA